MSTNWDKILGSDFERQVRDRMREWSIPGAAITLVPDDPAISPLYNIVNDDAQTTGPAVTAKTRFPVASCTKLVVALALAVALEQRGLDNGFDTRVIDVLPDLKLSDEDATRQCTVRDIIGHQTSIPAYDLLAYRPWKDDENVLSVVRDLPLSRAWKAPGPSVYSNVIQQITYLLIERLTGKPFEQYIRETVLQPIGMENTGWSVEAAGQEMALGHQLRYTSEGVDARLMQIKCEHDKLGKVCGMASLRMITTIGDVDCSKGILFGYPFKVKEHDDRIEVYGVDSYLPNSEDLPSAVLYRM